jgi:hypothetical protein
MSQPDQPPGQRQEFEFSITPETEIGTYADFVSVWHSPGAFTLDFATVLRPPTLTDAADGSGPILRIPARIAARVRIPPSQMFELMRALSTQLDLWEREQGQSNNPPLAG